MSSTTFQKVMEKITVPLPPLFVAMLEEACEHADKADCKDEERTGLALLVFATSVPLLKGLIDGAQQTFNSDSVTLEYRGQKFQVSDKSSLYQIIERLSDLPLS